MRARFLPLAALLGAAILLGACVKGNQEFNAGKKAELLKDYDTALVHYERALRQDPSNALYKLRVVRMRFEAGQYHVELGRKLLAEGQLDTALGQFQRALDIDPSSAIAAQLSRETMAQIEAKAKKQAPPAAAVPPEAYLPAAPPELKPISAAVISLKMTNDARIVYETIAKLAGLSVLFDPDFTARRITIDLPNVTLEQGLNAVALESKSFWKPVTSNIIFVAPDNPQKRRDYDDEEVRTFYLANTLTPQDITEIVTGLRQLLDLRRIQQINAQNAIVIRDTPDKLAVADKIIRDIDKARPEVVLQVSVMEVDMDRLRDLGILPGTSATLTFTPRASVQPQTSTTTGTTGGTTTSVPQITLNNLKHLSSADYSLTLPGAVAQAVLTDNTTKILQNPEVRVTDGQTAKLRIGDRVPIATGSFQAGVGVGVGAAGTSVVNPLVNTQFQYVDVGVNVDVTPRVHPDDQVSLKLTVEVSSVTGSTNIGGIQQPIISQRKIEHEIRLKEGETSLLGGLIQRTDVKNLQGWPGLMHIPFFRYFFSSEHTEHQDTEVMIALTPRIVRLPHITAANLRSLSVGTDTNVQVLPRSQAPAAAPPAPPAAPVAPGAAAPSSPAPAEAAPARLDFQPANLTLKPGQTATIGIQVENARDLFSIPLLLQYDPSVIQVTDVENAGFLSGGTEEIAIVQRVDEEHGQAIISATRQPNTPGVNGTGTLFGVVIQAVAPGTTPLAIVQVNARDSRQKPIPLVSGVATVVVESK
jgi:general secretion pathway protein D